ncbi:MAG: hypothetical protein H7259_01850 [Cytophagales bacterium]|nr:hypothetical protein [Cytophaga sp.]
MSEHTIYEIEQLKHWIQDGIVHGVYKRDGIITLDVAKQIISLRLGMQNGEIHPAIAYLSESHIITPAARKYFAKEAYIGLTKMAVIVNSKMKSNFLNIYILIDKPVKPTRVFTNKEEAIKWLKS